LISAPDVRTGGLAEGALRGSKRLGGECQVEQEVTEIIAVAKDIESWINPRIGIGIAGGEAPAQGLDRL
jgi:hypothetical protein